MRFLNETHSDPLELCRTITETRRGTYRLFTISGTKLKKEYTIELQLNGRDDSSSAFTHAD